MKLNRLIARHESTGRTRARLAIIAGRVRVDGAEETDISREVGRFHRVELDGVALNTPDRALYLMLHKPVGVVSATADPEHTTVIDLVDDPDRGTLHIAGRLDKNTSGLVLLTNDGRWSKRLMAPENKVGKIYQVTTRDPIPASAVEAFARGFHFHTEDLVTRPARLEILTDRTARLELHEGRYHQVKRMFHRIGNRVTALHRESIGAIRLPDELPPGCWRHLTSAEIRNA